MKANAHRISNSISLRFLIFLSLFCLVFLKGLHAQSLNKNSQQDGLMKESVLPPKASQKPLKSTLHNDTRIDNYAWLRDPKWPEVKNQEILAYLNEEKAYTEAFFKPLSDFQEKLYQEIKGRIQEDDSTYPITDGGYVYYDRNEKGKDYAIHCRKKIGSEKEEIFLDENELAQGKTFFDMNVCELSHDHQLLAYSTDVSGQECYTMRIKDLKTGQLLPDVLENTAAGHVVWHQKIKGFFYVVLNDKLRADRVYFHRIGDTQDKDQLIYQEKDETFSASLRYSADKHYVFIELNSVNMQEHLYVDLESNELTPKIIIPRREGHLYSVDYVNTHFYVLTNDKGANFRLARCTHDQLIKQQWEEVIAHNPASYLVTFVLYQEHLVYKRVENGAATITIQSLENKNEPVQDIPLTEAAYEINLAFTRYDDPFVRLTYSSLATPETVFEYCLATKTLHRRKTQQILGGFDTSDYHVERLDAPSKDGTLVPISLVYKKSLRKKEGNPTFLYGYGAYGFGIEAGFSSKALSLLDRGFIYAIAHIRGGDDLGYSWYEAGKLLNKKHTFEDFIACSEYLIEKGYTKKKEIAISGRSAGGMLMGYCANERPDLYRAVLAGVPFVDVLNTMLDGELPLTPGEYKEWGNPKEASYYHYIKSYSPYDNVKSQDYPHLYVTGSLNDPRVTYWEPAKWVAKLRSLKTDRNVLIFDINMNAGHFGTSGRYEYIKEEVAKEYAFLLHVFGIKGIEEKKGFIEMCQQTIHTLIERIKMIF